MGRISQTPCNEYNVNMGSHLSRPLQLGTANHQKLVRKLISLAHTRLDMASTARLASQFMLDPRKRQIIIREKKEIIHGGIYKFRQCNLDCR